MKSDWSKEKEQKYGEDGAVKRGKEGEERENSTKLRLLLNSVFSS